MSSRSDAFAAYLTDIYSEYDKLAVALSNTQIEVTAATTDYAVLGNLAGADIEALCFLVLMQAAKSAQEDLKAIMAEVKAINNTKDRQRDILKRLQAISEAASDGSDDHRRPGSQTRPTLDPCATLDSELFVQLIVTSVARQSDREAEALAAEDVSLRERYRIAKAADDDRGQLDAMSEMSEMTSMRLQMQMDRRSKFIEALSNILKKMRETQDAVIQNLK